MNLTKEQYQYLSELCYNDMIAWTEQLELENMKECPNEGYLNEISEAHDSVKTMYDTIQTYLNEAKEEIVEYLNEGNSDPDDVDLTVADISDEEAYLRIASRTKEE